jgi:hypothetical protein
MLAHHAKFIVQNFHEAVCEAYQLVKSLSSSQTRRAHANNEDVYFLGCHDVYVLSEVSLLVQMYDNANWKEREDLEHWKKINFHVGKGGGSSFWGTWGLSFGGGGGRGRPSPT